MIRLAVMILTMLMLNVVPLAASAHGIGMTALQPPPHAMPAAQPHQGPCAAAVNAGTPDTCDMQGDNPAGTALCDWLCTGMMVVAALHDTPAQRLVAGAPEALPAPLRAGMTPSPNERPPNLRPM